MFIMNIKDIKEIFSNAEINEFPKFIAEFSSDERDGVKKILLSAQNKILAHEKEIERVTKLNTYENYYYEHGVEIIGGIDEVGRGPLAGPVVAACVILPKNTIIPYIDDSKKLSEKKRNEIFGVIKEKALDIGIGSVDNYRIDEINILQATFEAMKIAINSMKIKPEMLLIDAVRIPGISTNQHPIVKGDSLSISIAAASIIAKVTRDEWMNKYAEEYSVYDFENNKGYGTAKHIDGIKQFGTCPIHRKSFLKSIAY